MSQPSVATLTGPVRDYAAMLDVKAVAAMLACSTRHVFRLADAGKMPRPQKLGALVRWRLNGPGGLQEWLDAGCPACEGASDAN